MKKPNFFIVGAPRCGTTSLFFYLGQHPGIYMSKPKEPFYFCTDFHRESDELHGVRRRFPIRNTEQYLALFRNVKEQTIIGEATSEYLYSKVAARNIYEFNSHAKILILLRDPVDFLHSMHAQLCLIASEAVVDFGKALEVEAERRKGRHLPRGALWPSQLYYSERVRFSEQIERYLDVFPSEQVRIVIFDDFKKDTLGTYRSILEFLEVDPAFSPRLNTYNPNRVVRFPFMNHILVALSDLPIKDILPFKIRDSLIWKFRRLIMKEQKRSPLEPNLRKELMQEVKPEVIKLSGLLQRDLTGLWGYDSI